MLGHFGLLVALCSGVYASNGPPCRFAPNYKASEILSDPSAFAKDFLYWEGHFHANNVGYNEANGMTYDGTLLNGTTGLHNVSGLHIFSAASKESMQIMVYAHALAGDPDAALFLSPSNPGKAKDVALGILETKLETYKVFNETFPGFGGFLPWFISNEVAIRPTDDWVNRVPALDNGELIWAVYAVVEVLQSSKDSQWQALAQGWQNWLDYTKQTAAKIFYLGDGNVCAVSDLNQSLTVTDPKQSYTCEGNSTLDDPYEGELFTWWLYFYGGLPASDKELLWQVKRPQLVSVEYHQGDVGPITVQKGYWFSAHEQWKLLEMPYLDIPLLYRLMLNGERARTCNSALNRIPGMYASVNNVTDSTGEIIGYISNAGIPSIANQTIQELDVVTPYSAFPVMLFNSDGVNGRGIGLVWWWNMVMGKKMQNPYGSTESERIDGTAVSSFVSWDSKITTVVAYLGGVSKYVKSKLIKEGKYQTFIDITQREYSRVFTELKGESQALCLPTAKVPDAGLTDYTQCSA